MLKPTINAIPAFDATRGYSTVITIGKDKSYGNKIWIYDTMTLKLIYEYPVKFEKKPDPVSMNCVIPANVLQNSGRYYMTVQCIGEDGVPGPMSDKYVFYCLATPNFTFRNVTDGDVINASFVDANVDYYQANGEKLQSYRFGLYDKNKVLISESELFYVASNDSLSYRFKGFGANKEYYLRCTGTTTRGLIADTGLIGIKAEYSLKKDYTQLELENKQYQGVVQYGTNIVLIGYELDSEKFLYPRGEAVDLTGRNLDYLSVLEYTSGFMIEGDWTCWLRLFGANMNTELLCFTNEMGQTIKIYAFRYDDIIKYKLEVSDPITKYIRYSNSVTYSKTKYHTIFLKCVNGLYDFAVFDGTQAEQGDYSLYKNNHGDLMLQWTGVMPSFRYQDPSLYYNGDDILVYEHQTGNLYKRVT